LSRKARSTVIEMMHVDVGFDFKEEDLSPKIRKEITMLAGKIDQAHYLWNLGEKARREANNKANIFYTCVGLALLLFLLWIVAPYLIFFSFLLFPAGYHYHRLSVKAKKKAIDYGFQGDSKWQEVVQETESLAKKAYDELTVLHEARVRPTIKQVTIDFARIIEAAKGKGIILETIECPYCKAPAKLPKNGDSFECQHCGRTIKAMNVFDMLKGIME